MDFTRIRNVPALPLSDLAAHEDQITFTGNMRPAEYTVSIFDSVSRVLAIHETQIGVSASMIAKYWQVLIHDLGKFRFDPILEQRAADLIMRAGAFSKFSLSLAHMGNEERMRNLGLTDHDILDLIRDYGSPNISVTLSIDPEGERRTLVLERVRNLATALLGLGKKHVKKLSLIIEDEEGGTIPVNLLKDRMVFKVTLTIQQAEETTHELRYRIIRDGCGSRKNELRRRYDGVE